MDLYTYKEAVNIYGSRAEIARLIRAGELYNPARNIYSPKAYVDPLAIAMKSYPNSIVTGFTAFYIHGLTDRIPQQIDLATKRNATRIGNDEIRQHFVANDIFDLGKTVIEHDEIKVRIYDLETMLFYLIKHDDKLPHDLFMEVMKAYRKRNHELNYSKLKKYADIRPGGRTNFERIIKEVL